MTQLSIDLEALKQRLKEALSEALHAERELLHEVFGEMLEDFALGEAIREGLETPSATREDVFAVIDGRRGRALSARVLRVTSKGSRTRRHANMSGKSSHKLKPQQP